MSIIVDRCLAAAELVRITLRVVDEDRLGSVVETWLVYGERDVFFCEAHTFENHLAASYSAWIRLRDDPRVTSIVRVRGACDHE